LTSHGNNKPTIGVAPWGQEGISTTVTKYSVADVKWNTESIFQDIRTYAK